MRKVKHLQTQKKSYLPWDVGIVKNFRKPPIIPKPIYEFKVLKMFYVCRLPFE